jgi:hypothetical protein
MTRTYFSASVTLPPTPLLLVTGQLRCSKAKGPDRLDSGLGQLYFRGTYADGGQWTP